VRVASYPLSSAFEIATRELDILSGSEPSGPSLSGWETAGSKLGA
jgi:hypothetical protein